MKTTTTTATAATDTILALDLSMYKSAACVYRDAADQRITRRGPRMLRKLLVECAWVMLRCDSWARAIDRRLTHGGNSRKKQAIVALARKLLVRCRAMLRDGTPWRDTAYPD